MFVAYKRECALFLVVLACIEMLLNNWSFHQIGVFTIDHNATAKGISILPICTVPHLTAKGS